MTYNPQWNTGSVGPEGPEGPEGPQGEPGSPGVGVPVGGVAGQVLRKSSGTDYDTGWATPSSVIVTVPVHADASASVTMTNQAVAEQFLGNNNRNIARQTLTDCTEARLVTRVVTGSASANSPRLRVMYDLASGGFSTTIGNFTSIGNAGEVACSLATAGVIDSGWVAIADAAKADVYLAVTQIGGDAVADPVVGLATLYFR